MSTELFPPGTVIDGRYRIIRPLGQGGFARVFEAEHVQLERRAALKILNYVAEPGDTFYQRFVREAKIAANLDHPNVVTIFDFGVVEGKNLPYIAMEALDGRDLYEELKENGPMRPARALPLFQGALEAIGVGHERGIVHKDLKPSNLFLVKPGTPQERLVVVDYGIARLNNDPNGQLTRTGAMSGTPAYLAPEYFQNQSVTPALDVYQMGLIIAETLTGQRVVDAATPVAIAVAHTSGQHNIPGPLLQSPLGPLLKKALAVEPTERFQNATEMGRALESIRPPSRETSFAIVDASEKKTHTPEAFAETAMTPSSDFAPGIGSPATPGADPRAPQPISTNDWGQNGSLRTPTGESEPPRQTAPGQPGPPQTRRPVPATQRAPKSSKAGWIIAAAALFMVLLFVTTAMVGGLFLLADDDLSSDIAVNDTMSIDGMIENGSVAIDNVPTNPGDFSLAPGTPKLNQKLYGYTCAHAMVFIIPYMMGFYESFKANFGLKNGDNVMVPPDLGQVYDMAIDGIRKSIRIRPARTKVDQAAQDFVDELKSFRPLIEDANQYYEVERGFETDGMAGGRTLDKRFAKAWPDLAEAEEDFAILLYQNWVAQQKEMVKKYKRAGNAPVRLRAAKLIQLGAELMIHARVRPDAPVYRKKLGQFSKAYNDYKSYVRSNDQQYDGQFGVIDPHKMLVGSAKSLSENAHKYPRARKEAKENAARLKQKKPNPVPDIQFMTQAFHQMVSNQNQMLANF